MTLSEGLGLAALLNSAIVDNYFRITNGNTQVNALELRSLPLPSLDVIRSIGDQIAQISDPMDFDQVDHFVQSYLKANLLIPQDL